MSSYLLSKPDQEILINDFKELVAYAEKNFSYYKDILKNINLNDIKALEDIQKFPILERSKMISSDLVDEVIAKNPPAYFETSGTTGNPFPVIPNLSPEKSQGFADFLDNWMSLKKDNVTKAIIALPFEMNPVGLKYFLGLALLGITSIPTGVRTHLCTPAKVLQIIERLKPELLIGRPLEILRYAESMQLDNQDSKKSSIKKIIFTGEIVSENKWKRISKIYGGAEVSGIFGLTEVDSGGLLSCKKYGYKYHLPQAPYLIVELLDDDLKSPVSDGEIGNIIFTNTEKNYLPLIRYNTGDRGKLHSTCDCGFGTPAIEIMGRKTDCISANGNEVYPIQIENIIFNYDEVGSEYQILTNNNVVSLRIEIQGSYSEINAVAEKIKMEIQNTLYLNVNIDAYPFGKLANKLGIAKEKAGKLYILDGYSDDDINEKLKINYC